MAGQELTTGSSMAGMELTGSSMAGMELTGAHSLMAAGGIL